MSGSVAAGAEERVETLTLTGERTLPGIAEENYWFRRHEAAYRFIVPACSGARVLEAGCGEGYGGQLLAAGGAATVLGADYDGPTLRHVRRTHAGVRPVQANLVALPCADASLDLVVSAQVIEHLWDQRGFVGECARVLRPGGRLVMTTPNRRTFPPGNPFHSRELDAAELVELVAGPLTVRALLGLRHGARLRGWERRHGDLVAAQLACPPDQWPEALRETVASVTAADFAVGGRHVDTSLDLLVVAERP